MRGRSAIFILLLILYSQIFALNPASRFFEKKYSKQDIAAARDYMLNFPVNRATRAEPVVGDTQTFWTYNFLTNRYEQKTATCKYVGTYCYVFVVNDDENLTTDAEIQTLGEVFDQKIYPNDTSWFGMPPTPGIDNDPKITILLLDIKDDGAFSEYYQGYFSFIDELPSSVAQQAPYFAQSNEREMFYIDLSPTSLYEREAVLAHEFQHMIHWYHDPDEEDWLNEGLSMFAELVNDFDIFDPYYREFLSAPDEVGLTNFDGRVANYGASFLFITYLVDTYGGKTTQEKQGFVNLLVSDDKNGVESVLDVLTKVTNRTILWKDLLGDWLIANYFDFLKQDNYSYKSINLPIIAAVKYEHYSYPSSSKTFDLKPNAGLYLKLDPSNFENKTFFFQGNTDTDWYVEIVGVKNTGGIEVIRLHNDEGEEISYSLNKLNTDWAYAIAIIYQTGSIQARFTYSIGIVGPKAVILPHPLFNKYYTFFVLSNTTPTDGKATYLQEQTSVDINLNLTGKIDYSDNSSLIGFNVYSNTSYLDKVGDWQFFVNGSNFTAEGSLLLDFKVEEFVKPDVYVVK